MTVAELVELRKRMGLTQAQMAEGMAMTLRPYQQLEAGVGELARRHTMLAERFALAAVAESDGLSPDCVPSAARKDVVAFAYRIMRWRDGQKIEFIA